MSKFSVKKPLTVFVAMLVVIIFGIIGYTKMTPDLLPNMDFPYVIIMTTYPGATPEEVEATVSKPMEQAMATLDNLKTVSSTSSENYSMVALEFETDTDMDTLMVDILQQVQTLSDAWDDMVGTPYIMKINPNMIPVAAAAVSVEDMDRAEISQFAADTLIPALEGTTGVASISTAGLLEQGVTITIQEDKIRQVNEELAQAVESSLAEVDQQLADAQAELDSQSAALSAAQSTASAGLGSAALTLDETLAAYQSYSAQLTAMQASKSALEAERAAYAQGLEQINNGIAQADAAIGQLQTTRAMLAPVVSSGLDGATPLSALISDPMALAALQAQGCNTVGDAITLDATLAQQITTLQTTRQELAAQQPDAQQRLSQIDTELANMNTQLAVLQGIVDQYSAAIGQARDGYVTMQQSVLQAAASFGSGQAMIASGQASLNEARAEYESSVELALQQADLSGVITMETVSALLGAQHFDMPAGFVEQDGVSWVVSVGDDIESVDALEDLVLFDTGVEGVEPVRLSDVADVTRTDNADSIYAALNGEDSLILIFSKQSTYSTAGTSDNLNAAFAELEAKYPGLSFTSLMDQGDYIYTITDAIVQSLLLGALFAVIILFVFLRDWKPTLIVLFSIPLSVLFAVTLMYFAGVSLNMMSLSGLAVSVGMLVDNSVVVIENTYRLRALGQSKVKAAVSGAAQVAAAITASTLTTVCVFVPILFTDGLTKQLFTDMALTITFSLMASLIIALTLVPAMSGLLLGKIRTPKAGAMDRFTTLYRKTVRWSVERKGIVIAASIALLLLSGALVLSRGFSFLPDTETDQLSVTVTMPEETTFAEQCDLADQVIERIQPIEGIDTVGAMMSSGDDAGSMALFSTGGDVSLYIQLDPDNRRPVQEIKDEINNSCADLDCEVNADSSSLMGTYTQMLAGSGISIDVYANDLDDLQQAAIDIADVLAQVEGVAEAHSGINDPSPELHFTVDKEAAMAYGLTVAQVYAEVADALTTQASAISLTDDGTTYQITVTTDEAAPTLQTLQEHTFTVEQADGTMRTVALDEVTEAEETQTLSSINRLQQRRYLTVTASLEEGENVTLTTNRAEDALSNLSLPAGVQYEFNGQNESILSALGDLILMMLVGMALVYLIMVAQFQSLKSPFIVMFTIPLAFTGGFIALLICGMDISILSMLGMVMLVGIIVNNGIVLVDCINNLRLEGMERREAILEACTMRLRPILMTSITTVLGLSVMALGLDESSAMMQPLAVTCIGGLLYATLMTLLVIPGIYDLLNKKELRQVDEAELEVSDL